MIPITRYGATFASAISKGRTGVTKSDSKVPRSHSRAISIEARNVPMSVMIRTMIPGTRYQVLIAFGLNQIRCTTDIPPPTVMPPRRAASFAPQFETALSTYP